MEDSKIAFVTGANKGIGLATSRLLAKNGYQVWMGVRSMERGRATYRELKSAGLDVHLIRIDISDSTSVEEATEQLKTKIDHLDILINNAGFASDLSVIPSEESLEAIKKQYETNTFGPIG